MSLIKREAYPAIFKIINDTEMLLSEMVGSKVSIKIEIKENQLTQAETNRLWLQSQVCNEFNVGWADIAGRERKRNIVDARKTYSYLAYKYLKLSLNDIGRDIQKDHTTVLYLKKICTTHIEMKDDMAIHVTNIQKRLYQNISKA